MLWKPVQYIAVVTGDAKLMPFTVADDRLLGQIELFAKTHAKLCRFLIDRGEVVFAL